MLFTYNEPSKKILDEIRAIAEANYPDVPPASDLNRIATEICKENGIDDPCKMDMYQALVVINYQLGKITDTMISNKYSSTEKGYME